MFEIPQIPLSNSSKPHRGKDLLVDGVLIHHLDQGVYVADANGLHGYGGIEDQFPKAKLKKN